MKIAIFNLLGMLGRLQHLDQVDPEIGALIRKELKRQNDKIELIVLENIVSEAVMDAMGTSRRDGWSHAYRAVSMMALTCLIDTGNLTMLPRPQETVKVFIFKGKGTTTWTEQALKNG
jgi:hypothetical protein